MAEVTISRAPALLAERDPDGVALRSGRRVVTRRALVDLADGVARRWVAEGLGVDDVVVLGCGDPVDLVLAAVATWRAGATPLPLAPGLAPGERAALLDLARPARVEDGPLDLTPGRAGAPLPDRAASSWKVAASSGSTGRPKLVRAAAPARVDPDRPVAAFVPRDAVQLVASPPHAGAGFVYATRGLTSGHELVLMPSFDAGEWLRLVAGHRVTWSVLSPTTMRAIARHPDRATADVSSLESVLHVGARCPEPLKRDWLAWLGPSRVVEVYAGTESAGVAMIGGEDWLLHPGSVGRGVGGTRFRVVRPDGGDCAPGEVGEILMRRDAPTYTYVGAAAQDRHGWHSLGDAGRTDADGWLWVLDRLDDLVDVDGHRVAPADVEAALLEHPDVGSAVVVGRGGGLHAVVQCPDLDAVRAWAATRLDPPHLPTGWEAVPHPLRDDAGKARRSSYR
ncbi:AMP-binding protein [uncultured Nocardioides sp.]|uniref:AMP-binding protein n=1 Tax=uncultured Nocardioides sp. TaxID=198441 RepID=UPI002628C928|nr:AMP-binding protein [uncultured Nocardioides sp.]